MVDVGMVVAFDPPAPATRPAPEGEMGRGIIGFTQKPGRKASRRSLTSDAIRTNKEKTVGEAILAGGGRQRADDLRLP